MLTLCVFRRHFYSFTLILMTLLLSLPALSNIDVAHQGIVIPRIQGDITIDAQLNELQWQQAKTVKLNLVTRPYNNTKSPVETQALLMEDGEKFYLAFIAQDPQPEHIRAFLHDRDKSWSNDLVGVKLDTYNDKRTAYRFMVNPLGAQIDGIESEVTKKESDAWDGVWQSAGKITAQGYLVEIALPLAMLTFDDSKALQTWGIELVRFYPRSKRLRISNLPLDRANSCELCQMTTVSGFEGIEQGRNIMITPALVTTAVQEKELTISSTEHNLEASLDFRWGITPDLLLNATINPDFSTVETDNARLNINNNNALSFDEKRPFFLDNQDYFDSLYNLVYTRNINAPDYGAKLTGRYKSNSFGLFLTNDTSTNILIPGNLSSTFASIEAPSKAAAFRYRNSFTDNITLGWSSTLRSSDNYQNSVHGIDTRVRLSTTDVVNFQTLISQTQYPSDLFTQFCDSEQLADCADLKNSSECNYSHCDYTESLVRSFNDKPFDGHALQASYYHNGANWYYFARHSQQNSGFRADLGFIPKADTKKTVIGSSYRWFAEQDKWWSLVKIYSDWDITHNYNGELIEKEFDINLQLRAKYNSFFKLAYTAREKVGQRSDKSLLAITGNTSLFTENKLSLLTEIKPVLGLFLKNYISYGDTIDYRNNRLGESILFVPTLKWNINQHLEVKLKQTFRRLDADNANVFTARLTDFRATYQFSILSFIRFSLVYNNTHRNVDNYLYESPDDIDSVSKDLSTELLYAYKINPQTVFYLGYSDHHDSESTFKQLRQDTRSAFMKFSYAWMP